MRISILGMLAAVLAIGMVLISASPLPASGNVGINYTPQHHIGLTSYLGQYMGMKQPGQYAAGTIASLQNDKNGKPAWIVSGFWKASLTNLTSEMPGTMSSNTALKRIFLLQDSMLYIAW